MTNAAAGWFDQGDGTQRYWDGNAWTDHSAPSAVPGASAAAPPTPATAPAPAPAYAAAPPYTPAPSPKKRKVWPWVVGILGGLALLVIGFIVVIFLVVADAVSGPNDAVSGFDEAWTNADCDKLDETTTQNFRDTMSWSDCETFQANAEAVGGSESFVITGTEVVNDTATVTTTETYLGDDTEYNYTYHLIKEDGVWKIDSAE